MIQAGQGQNPARQVALKAGIDIGTPAMTLNNVCLQVYPLYRTVPRIERAKEIYSLLAVLNQCRMLHTYLPYAKRSNWGLWN